VGAVQLGFKLGRHCTAWATAPVLPWCGYFPDRVSQTICLGARFEPWSPRSLPLE
jgi:hypothetical protein